MPEAGTFCTTLAAMVATVPTSPLCNRARQLKACVQRIVITCITLLLVVPACISAQAHSAAGRANSPVSQKSAVPASTLQSPAPALSGLHPVATLDGPWRFQIGDDPSFASPTFDDSNWITVYLSKPLSEQGIGSYSGFAWYRLRLQPEQLSALGLGTQNDPSELLVTGNSVGQLGLFINGLETGRTEGMGDKLASYQSPPFVSSLSAPAADGSRVLAVRTWAPAGVPVRRGILARVDLGPASAIATLREAALARAWTGNALSSIAVAFLFFCVAILGAALYFAQRGHSEYLWLTLLCLVVACNSVIDTLFDLSHLPLESTQLILRFGGHLFIIVTLEFVLRFTGSSWRRTVRGAQLLAVVLPFTGFFLPFLVYRVLAVSAQAFFCTLACIILFRAWRMGQRDAGVMLIPFFLASMADSADTVLNYFASIHWLPAAFASRAYHFGPIDFGIDTLSYLVFLFSIVAVILFRFIRVSQDEQRSAAEISAARSVQALLIPTQLPRSRHFVLESAYLPINGVGGDFFQVFPLQDDSLLLVVGDVSGKGLQAAMNSSTLVGALRNELSYDPATILAHLNRVLIGAVASPGAVPEIDAAPGFATCLCARIYPDGSMTIANAGHLSPYRDGREMEIEPNLPLGVIAGVEYSQTTHTFSQGQRIVFVSDGVVEAANAQGELFGFDRTRQVSVESARYIAQTAKHFGQTDDITVVSLYIAATDASPGTSTARHSQIGAVESA